MDNILSDNQIGFKKKKEFLKVEAEKESGSTLREKENILHLSKQEIIVHEILEKKSARKKDDKSKVTGGKQLGNQRDFYMSRE